MDQSVVKSFRETPPTFSSGKKIDSPEFEFAVMLFGGKS